MRLVLQSQLLHEQGTRIVTCRELKSRATWDMEVESEKSPLSLSFGRHSLDGGDVERHEDSLGVVRHEHSVVHLVDINETGLEVLGELPLIVVCLDVLHLLDLLLLGATLNLSAVPPLPELLDLAILQFTLRLLPRLLLLLYLEVLGAQTSRLDLVGVDVAAHVD